MIDRLISERRVVELRVAGQPMLAVIEDIPRLRDGLGIPVPPGVAATFTETAAHPIDDLVLRWARTHGPFVASSIAQRYGLGRAIVDAACDGLVAHGTLVAGSFVDMVGEAANERRQYCSSQVLALIKRRTLALLRKGVEPVEQIAFARFLAEWQGVGSGGRGVDAVLGAIEQLSGYPMPASAVESMILPARVADYASSMLDELTAAGEIYWVGDGPIGDSDGWVRWYVADQEPHAPRGEPSQFRSQELLAALASGGAYFFDALLPAGLLVADRSRYLDALWELVWAGQVTGDTFSRFAALLPVVPIGGPIGPSRGHIGLGSLPGASAARLVRRAPPCRPRRAVGRWCSARPHRARTVWLRISSPSWTATGW